MKSLSVAIFQIGKYYDSPDIIKVFSSFDKAMEHVPKGFKQIQVLGSYYYAENKRRGEWLSIKCYEVE